MEITTVFENTKVLVIEQDWGTNREFFHELGSEPTEHIRSEAEGGDDWQFEKRGETEIRLFKYVCNILCRSTCMYT